MLTHKINRRAASLAVAIATCLGAAPARAQAPAGVAAAPVVTPSIGPVPSPADLPPGTATVEVGASVLPPGVQVVRFQGPEGVVVEVLGPNPEPVPVGDGKGLATVGMRVGVGYRLRLTNLPERPGAELYPVVEVVGHLHRPPGIDPAKFPIRVVFSLDDLFDAVDRGRLVTQVVYLEDPEQALPIGLPKDEIPIVSLTPAEEPLKVASKLGRVMVIVRLGGRRPTPEELSLENAGGLGAETGPGSCPFAGPEGARCPLPCGPVCGTPPPPGKPWIPRDEYLCDGGDHAEPAHFGGDGGLRGIDPRDAVIQFSDDRRPRVLPTNRVCIYAPRFAMVRTGIGPNEDVVVQSPIRATVVERQQMAEVRQESKRFVQNQAPETGRHRARASALAGRVFAGEQTELRVLSGFDVPVQIATGVLVQEAETARERRKAGGMQQKLRAVGIKTAESAVVTGIVAGAGQTVMTWTPREAVGVESPPNRPGLAVVKRVSTGEAEAGDVVTFTIQYRNMGNTPIRSVSVIDSLLPRLGYIAGSARGPAGTVFTAAENRVGSTELRWDLPGAIPPGAEGYVSFEVTVR